jgi:adenosyl cobinamide kinase/adenosyl cobinamide phosphate guanylyltransferase
MRVEYVAIGEEWASFDALQQLGLVVKRREEGRVLLDPSTTWVSYILHKYLGLLLTQTSP